MGKPQSERLNNDEFLKLIPHLHADEIINIEIKLSGIWNPMVAITSKSQKPNYLICNLCKQNLNLSEFKRHLQSTNHIAALPTVEQFFHPYYTYDKSSEKLAKGIDVSDEELKEGIDKAVEAIKKIDMKKFEKQKSLALQLYEEESIKLKRIITQLALKTDAKTPPQIFVDVTLSLTEMLQLEFSDQKDVWKKMLITSTPARLNGNYTCVICSKNLSGIITVNAHFNGYTHKVAQLATLGVRLRQKNNLTKNCSYQYETKYSVQVNKTGKEFFKKEALAKINERSNFKKDDKPKNENNDENEGGKKDRFLDSNSKLPASLAEKANILARLAKTNMRDDKNEKHLKKIAEEDHQR
ncbi:uncharacterized protein LOC119676500 [Teleopsis dalmanni]|uniref:uncharacterized protein LOC119676500 n=1 Tax=Teleopsis dalmanni TaxID=139649 RepID=UPI0018CF8321|nr:uncharacterized protein LOC119676500 [Teleopsis dalmanni]